MKKAASLKTMIWFISILLLNASPTHAQFGFTNEVERELSYAELWEEILTCKEEKYSLENALVTKGVDDYKKINLLLQKDSIVTAEVYIYNVKFKSEKAGWLEDYSVQFNFKNIKLEKPFSLMVVSGINMLIADNCHFEGGFSFFPEDKILSAQLLNCTVNKNLEIYFPEKPTKVYKVPPYLIIDNCELKLKSTQNIQLNEYSSLYILNSKFKKDSSDQLFTIKGHLKFLEIKNCQLDINLIFKDLIILEHVKMIKSEFDIVGFDAVTFPAYTNNYIKWSQFKNGFSIILPPKMEFIDGESIETSPLQIIDNIEEDGLPSELMYDELMASYHKFFNDYHQRGDSKSANACYIAMKDVQTSKLKLEYEEDKTTENWLYWKLNSFLKYFADYGTNPIKSIMFSIWTILGFAFLYFFVYSTWDKINRSYLIGQHRKLMRYFNSKQSMKDLYTKEKAAELISYQDYKRELKINKDKVPFFVNIFGRPLYLLSVQHIKWRAWLFNRTEIMHTSWSELSSSRKRLVGLKAFIALSVYIFYLILTRATNSIFLSINAFSTLGFGDIPVTGISRYLAILEGFIGWFLLSIFSVSLISQILQN